jgi:hypothetical protein
MKNMRDEMPNTALTIDVLRLVFGADLINQQIKTGMTGLPTFYASENGLAVGTVANRNLNGFELDGEDFLRIGLLCRENKAMANRVKRNER